MNFYLWTQTTKCPAVRRDPSPSNPCPIIIGPALGWFSGSSMKVWRWKEKKIKHLSKLFLSASNAANIHGLIFCVSIQTLPNCSCLPRLHNAPVFLLSRRGQLCCAWVTCFAPSIHQWYCASAPTALSHGSHFVPESPPLQRPGWGKCAMALVFLCLCSLPCSLVWSWPLKVNTVMGKVSCECCKDLLRSHWILFGSTKL